LTARREQVLVKKLAKRQQHPPPRKFRVYVIESEKGLTWGNVMCPRFLARKYISAYAFRGLQGKEGLEETNDFLYKSL
jgi:hypothetical protein